MYREYNLGPLSSTDERLLAVLRQSGPQTLDTLARLPGLSMAQILLAVDRLSRAGAVALRQMPNREYQVVIRMPGS